MVENSELEEGEVMNCSTSDAFVDLDVDLSYLDEKVQNVLGHFQKDFQEGAVDLFGPNTGDYGSFLPTYKRSLPVPSCQRSFLGNHVQQRFSNNLPGKNVVQKFQAPPAASCKVLSNQNPHNCQTSGSLLTQAPNKVRLEKGNATITGNGLSDRKPIRVRIKMGTEILSQKVTMVRNDPGHADSPPRNNIGPSSKMLPDTSTEQTSESPYRILQEMTAIPVPEGLLMSPLPDSLFLVKDKEKQYTLVNNRPVVVKAGKEPSVQTQNKSSDVLCCGETPSGRRRKAVECFDDNTWNESASIGDMKKQKVFPTGQLARKNSTCDLGGVNSTIDGLTTKSKLQKGIKKDKESDPRVAFAKSDKTKFVGKQTGKEKETYPTKLKLNSSKNHFGDKVVSKMPFKDAAHISQNSKDIWSGLWDAPSSIGLDLEDAPSTTAPDQDLWAQCDSCQTWRLLPFGLKPEQLPDKWLCSMQTWLPGMNHCGVSEEETTNAIKSFHGPDSGVKLLSDASNADQSYHPVTSCSFPNPMEKKSTVKDLSQGVSNNIMVDGAKPMRSNIHVFKIKHMKLPLDTPNASQIYTDPGVSHDFLQDKIDQKAKRRSAGTGRQIKTMKKKEGNKRESEGSKPVKTGDGNKFSRDIKAEEIHWNQNLEWTPAERKTNGQDNDCYTSDVERDTTKRLLASKNKPDHIPQVTTGSGSLCTKTYGRISSPVRKIRSVGYKQGNTENSSKLFADGEVKEPSVEKPTTTKISVRDFKAHQRNELFQADGSREHQNDDASCKYFSGGSGQISGVETSCTSKVLGSHKSGKRYVEEVKASPVESVSSSPARSSCPKNLVSAGEIIACKTQDLRYGDAVTVRRIVNNRKLVSRETDCEVLSTTHSSNMKQPKPEECEENSMLNDLSCTSMEKVLKSRDGITNFSAITHETMDRSSQAANHVLQEAEKLKKLAECYKTAGFDNKHKEANFDAALKFLLGASLLEMCSTENGEGAKMSHVEAYSTAAKLSESCAHQYETSQDMAAATLAYKCTEVACMRIVYGKSLGLNGEWNDLQRMVQMTPQGESPSSSASDVDSFCHQGVTDKSAKSRRGLSHISGNLLPVGRSQQNFVPLLDFTEHMNLAMEASAKSQNAFRAASVTTEETQDGDCISAIKRVVDFSFHDVEALIQMIEIAMRALRSSRCRGPKC